MQTIDQERKVLLGVLLVVALELITADTDGIFEETRQDRLAGLPHALEQQTKSMRHFALEPKRVPQVDLPIVQLTLHKVLVDDFEIGNDLHCTIHVARVA